MPITEEQRKYLEQLEHRSDADLMASFQLAETKPRVNPHSVRITIRVPIDLMDKIDNACENLGRMDRSTLIRWAMKEWVDRNPDKVADPDAEKGE